MSETAPNNAPMPEDINLDDLLKQQEQAHDDLKAQEVERKNQEEERAKAQAIKQQQDAFLGDVSTEGKSHKQLSEQSKTIKDYAEVRDWLADAHDSESFDELLAPSKERAYKAPTAKEVQRDFALSGLAGNSEIQSFIENKNNGRTGNLTDEQYKKLDAKATAYLKAKDDVLSAMAQADTDKKFTPEHNSRILDALEQRVSRLGVVEMAKKDYGIDLAEETAPVIGVETDHTDLSTADKDLPIAEAENASTAESNKTEPNDEENTSLEEAGPEQEVSGLGGAKESEDVEPTDVVTDDSDTSVEEKAKDSEQTDESVDEKEASKPEQPKESKQETKKPKRLSLRKRIGRLIIGPEVEQPDPYSRNKDLAIAEKAVRKMPRNNDLVTQNYVDQGLKKLEANGENVRFIVEPPQELRQEVQSNPEEEKQPSRKKRVANKLTSLFNRDRKSNEKDNDTDDQPLSIMDK